MPRHVMTGSLLLERARPRLGTDSVVIAAVAGKANATTAMGAMIFFWARLAYAIIYVAGIPWLRTVAWTASVVGMIMIALQLF